MEVEQIKNEDFEKLFIEFKKLDERSYT